MKPELFLSGYKDHTRSFAMHWGACILIRILHTFANSEIQVTTSYQPDLFKKGIYQRIQKLRKLCKSLFRTPYKCRTHIQTHKHVYSIPIILWWNVSAWFWMVPYYAPIYTQDLRRGRSGHWMSHPDVKNIDVLSALRRRPHHCLRSGEISVKRKSVN